MKCTSMMDCKSMATSMEVNMKKLHDSAISLDLVDPTKYCQLIGSLLYLPTSLILGHIFVMQ